MNLEIIATILSILGNLFIIYKNRYGFLIWIIANISWMYFAWVNNHVSMLILFFWYTLISIWGFVKWGN